MASDFMEQYILRCAMLILVAVQLLRFDGMVNGCKCVAIGWPDIAFFSLVLNI